MNGPHDLGGRHGFGPVVPDADEAHFHAPWESRVLALTLAMGATGTWTLDQSRHARERLAPASYLRWSYYRIWFEALSLLLKEQGLVEPADYAAPDAVNTAPPLKTRLEAGAVTATLAKGGPVDRPPNAHAAFAVGDRVRTLRTNPQAHTRLPAYAHGVTGRIARVHGCHVYADASAMGDRQTAHWLYSVRFEAADLWGPETTAAAVHLDLWEPYLERA